MFRVRSRYPGAKQTCELIFGDPTEWAVEVKMWRPNGDNGKPDDTAIKDIVSLFAVDRGALSDCVKLAKSSIVPRRAILIYGFDDGHRPLHQIVAAFEKLATERVNLGTRQHVPLGPLVHSVHRAGAVFPWEVARQVA